MDPTDKDRSKTRQKGEKKRGPTIKLWIKGGYNGTDSINLTPPIIEPHI